MTVLWLNALNAFALNLAVFLLIGRTSALTVRGLHAMHACMGACMHLVHACMHAKGTCAYLDPHDAGPVSYA